MKTSGSEKLELKISSSHEFENGTVLARVRLGSYASLLALIPICGMVFFVLGMGELGVGGISVLSLWTLFWLSVLVFGVFDHGILSMGPDGVVWTSGVGWLSMKTRVQVDAWTWSRVVRLRGFCSAVELVGRDGQGHVVYESPFNGRARDSAKAEADCERIRQLLAEKAHVSLTRIRGDDERTAAAAIEAQGKITALRDDDGRIVRIIYRPRRYVRGTIVHAVIIVFFSLVGWLVWTKGDSPWLIAACVIPAILAVAPTIYDVFGRREFVIGAGTGHYFNGVGRIGVCRKFSFDEKTRVRKGESAYYYADHSVGHKDTTGTRAMTRIPEVQLLPAGCATPTRLCASDDEALIDAFVRLLREAIQHKDMHGA